MTAIIDYKMGNMTSIENALDFLGEPHYRANSKEEIENSSRIILPGVGSYKQAMSNIMEMDIYTSIKEAALEKKIPILGICLGMQLLSDEGTEEGLTKGLGLIPGKVTKITSNDQSLKIPHIGFNTVYPVNNSKILDFSEKDFYFVHSYHFETEDKFISSICKHGGNIVSSVEKDNIFGTQFHPEKSQANGLHILKKFLVLGK